MQQQSGGCLCGAVRYQFDAEPIAAVHCHCSDCQKATGSGFATVFGLPDRGVTITGQASVSYFTLAAASGQEVTRGFCRCCGSPLFTEAQNNPGFLWIKAGSLDDASWLQPSAACWTGSAQPWATPVGQLEHYEGNP